MEGAVTSRERVQQMDEQLERVPCHQGLCTSSAQQCSVSQSRAVATYFLIQFVHYLCR